MKKNGKITRRSFVKSSAMGSLLVPFAPMGLWSHSHEADWLLDNLKTSWETDDPFLSGNNYPVFEENYLSELKVSGEIPSDIKGMFLRNGPNPMFKPKNYVYPFSGDGMVHGIFFDDKKVYYRNKWVKTESLRADIKASENLNGNGAVANTNVLSFGNKILAMADAGQPYILNKELDTLGVWTDSSATSSIVAHPRIDNETGEMHYFSYSMFRPPYLTYLVIDKQGKLIRDMEIDLPNGSMIHDCVLTENYAIFFDCPVVPNMDKARKGENPFEWKPGNGTKVGIIDRNDFSKPVKMIITEPFFVWHFMNAFEKGGELNIDLIRHNLVPFVRNDREYQYLPTTFHRMAINLESGQVGHQDIDDLRVEFPTIDVRRSGKAYRFGYAPVIRQEHLNQKLPEYFNQLVQYDLKKDRSLVHNYGKDRFSGESIFVPKMGKNTEEEGYVMSFVFDEKNETSDIVILDPLNFDKEPVAIIHLPVRVPNGLHGNWING